MTYPSNSADGQVRAFIDRILRMKEEEKAIKDDIKEIYAEAKANGFDKTQLGRAVTIVQKRQKDGDAVDEADAILDLYLAAYYGTGTRVATHTHAHEDHDPETGEVLDASSTAARKDVQEQPARRGDGPSNGHQPNLDRGGANSQEGNVPPDTRQPAADTQTPPVETVQENAGGSDPDGIVSGPVEAAASIPQADGAPHTREGAPADEAEPTQVEASSVTPKRKWTHSDPAHRDCLNPEQCGGFSNHGLCQRCKDAAA